MRKRCDWVSGGRRCRWTATKRAILSVPGHELYPIIRFQCSDHIDFLMSKWARELRGHVDVKVEDYDG